MAPTNGHTAPNGASSSIDPITLRVLNGAFTAVAKEMAHVLYRMSYSSLIRESEDLGAGLYDAEGNEICESDTSPMHVGSLPAYIRGFLKRLKGKINDGDVILHNHPYQGATHTPSSCDGDTIHGIRRSHAAGPLVRGPEETDPADS